MIAKESRYTDPIMLSVRTSPHFHNAYRIFCYSKVVQASKLTSESEQLHRVPWLHCVVIPKTNTIVQYIWDTREIVNAFDSAEIAKEIREMSIADCANDAYSAWSRPVLRNSAKISKAAELQKLASKWVEPKVIITLYRQSKNKSQYEFDIMLSAPGLGHDILAGNYRYDAVSDRSELDFSMNLLEDMYPDIRKVLGSKHWLDKFAGPLNYERIHSYILDKLTSV